VDREPYRKLDSYFKEPLYSSLDFSPVIRHVNAVVLLSPCTGDGHGEFSAQLLSKADQHRFPNNWLVFSKN
jgi:hypothetical protein